MKPGYKTTEFWMTLGTQVLTIAVILGVVPSDDIDMLGKAIAGVISGVVSLITLVTYVRGRVELKQQAQRIEDTRV